MLYANSSLPFGGVGYSGLNKYHGAESFRQFSNFKPVCEVRDSAINMFVNKCLLKIAGVPYKLPNARLQALASTEFLPKCAEVTKQCALVAITVGATLLVQRLLKE